MADVCIRGVDTGFVALSDCVSKYVMTLRKIRW